MAVMGWSSTITIVYRAPNRRPIGYDPRWIGEAMPDLYERFGFYCELWFQAELSRCPRASGSA